MGAACGMHVTNEKFCTNLVGDLNGRYRLENLDVNKKINANLK